MNDFSHDFRIGKDGGYGQYTISFRGIVENDDDDEPSKGTFSYEPSRLFSVYMKIFVGAANSSGDRNMSISHWVGMTPDIETSSPMLGYKIDEGNEAILQRNEPVFFKLPEVRSTSDPSGSHCVPPLVLIAELCPFLPHGVRLSFMTELPLAGVRVVEHFHKVLCCPGCVSGRADLVPKTPPDRPTRNPPDPDVAAAVRNRAARKRKAAAGETA